MTLPDMKWLPRSILGFVALVLLYGLNSCEQPEGPGGKGVIRGKVILRTYDEQFRVLQSVYPAADEDVYIQYGDTEAISDDRNTSPDGTFEFQYLSKGDYTVLIYSEDSTGNSPSGIIPIKRQVNLSTNSMEVDLGEIYIYETLDVDEGQASIKGRVMQVNYSLDFLYIIDTIPAQGVDVYMSYETDLNYSDRIRTLYDGTFAFPNLIKGNYRIFVYSEDIERGTELVPVIKSINIDALQGEFDTGILYIAKED